MRITERRLRQIIREELTAQHVSEAETAPIAPSAPLKDPVARRHTTALGNLAYRQRDLEDEIKKALLNSSLLSVSKNSREKFQYYITDTDPTASVGTDSIVVDVLPDKSWFVFTWPDHDMSTTPQLKQSIHDELLKLWALKPGEVSSPNIDRLQSLRGRSYELIIDFPQKGESEDALRYVIQRGDTLSALLLHFYGLPLSKSNYPIYRLFANQYMSPPSNNPDVISAGATLMLPASIESPSLPKMKRIKDSKP